MKRGYAYHKPYQDRYRERNREAIRERNSTPERRAKARARARAWYAAHKVQKIARVSAYARARPAKARRWHKNYEARVALPCPFCHRKMRETSTSCAACLKTYGYLCKNNPLCAVQGRHKHCPACSFPVMNPQLHRRAVELCGHCIEEAKRGAYMRATESTDELEAA